jgi:hypothetical protein
VRRVPVVGWEVNTDRNSSMKPESVLCSKCRAVHNVTPLASTWLDAQKWFLLRGGDALIVRMLKLCTLPVDALMHPYAQSHAIGGPHRKNIPVFCDPLNTLSLRLLRGAVGFEEGGYPERAADGGGFCADEYIDYLHLLILQWDEGLGKFPVFGEKPVILGRMVPFEAHFYPIMSLRGAKSPIVQPSGTCVVLFS